MALYPSLEEMKVCKMAVAQIQAEAQAVPPQIQQSPDAGTPTSLYPSLGEYMGLELGRAVVEANMPQYATDLQTYTPAYSGLVAPISGHLQKVNVTNGIRELVMCKGSDDKVGMRVKDIDNGIFVCLVVDKSPAAMVGLRFGDQILQINGVNVAGYSMDKVHKLLKKSPVNGINVVVRDRPFERTITLHKDSTNHVGFLFKNGKITSIVKDSSAARNGLLINHQVIEVQGQNVVGLKDKDISKLIDDAGATIIVTIIPSMLYDHMVKKMAGSLIKNLMDHTSMNF